MLAATSDLSEVNEGQCHGATTVRMSTKQPLARSLWEMNVVPSDSDRTKEERCAIQPHGVKAQQRSNSPAFIHSRLDTAGHDIARIFGHFDDALESASVVLFSASSRKVAVGESAAGRGVNNWFAL